MIFLFIYILVKQIGLRELHFFLDCFNIYKYFNLFHLKFI